MRNHIISYSVLGAALVAGASAANAQTVISREIVTQPVETVVARQPDAMVVAQDSVVTVPSTAATVPVETVETVRTVRSTTTVPAARIANRHVARRHTADRVTTTRTIVRERVVPAPVVAPAPAVEAVSEPTYTEVVPPAYPRPLYDVVPPAPVAPPPAIGSVAAPVAGPPAYGAGIAVPTYRYVYEPDRILVIDPYTNITVQAIPR